MTHQNIVLKSKIIITNPPDSVKKIDNSLIQLGPDPYSLVFTLSTIFVFGLIVKFSINIIENFYLGIFLGCLLGLVGGGLWIFFILSLLDVQGEPELANHYGNVYNYNYDHTKNYCKQVIYLGSINKKCKIELYCDFFKKKY